MQYHVAHIETCFAKEWQKDLFEQALFDFGFDTIDGNDYYIPSNLWKLHHEAIEDLCQFTPEATLIGVEACPDENWNAVWESEHAIEELPMGVRIVPHCAFGAGHHETTSMLIDALLAYPMTGKTVLDNGCGTGVLGIMAARCGADSVIAVDIDDKSVSNTIENAALNGVKIEASLGSTPPEGHYDLILSNIHRNILIDQMPLYARYLRPQGELWISGFMDDDCAALVQAAIAQGMQHKTTRQKGEWCMMQFVKV